MSVIIGNVTVDGGTGTPHPPLSLGALKDYASTAAAYRYKGTAPTSEGAMLVWHDCTKVEAQQKLRALGGLIGYVVVVTYTHGSITGVAVESVRGEWQAKAGTVNGGVMVANITFNRESDKENGDEAKSLVIVQTASALAGPWTTEDGWASLKGSSGLGTYAGEAVATVVNVAPDQTKVGKWVRMVLKSAVDPNAPTPAEIEWAGVITGVSSQARRDPAQGIGWGAETAYRCAGVAHVFAQLYPLFWWEFLDSSTNTPMPFQGSVPVSSTFCDVGRPIGYNTDGIGNMGAATVQLDASPAPLVHLHARGLGTEAGEWTAAFALRNAIAQVRRGVPTLPPIVVDAGIGDAKLGYIEPWATGKQSLLGLIDTIANTDNSRAFRLAIDWATTPVSIKVIITDATITTGDAGIALDLTDDDIASWNADYDGGTVRDTWALDAGDRSYIMTVEARGSNTELGHQRGWLASQETAWDAAEVEERNNSKLVHVWRQFTLSPKWAGENALGALVMPYQRTMSGSEETGELSPGATDRPSGIVAWMFDRALPLGEGYDWSVPITPPSGSGGVVTRIGPATGPLVWWRKVGEPLDQLHDDYQITFGDATASVVFGRTAEEGDAIKTKLTTDGFNIWMTVAFVHPLTWRCTAVQAPARTDAPRIGITWLPASMFNRVDMLASTVLGVDSSGAPVYGTAGRRDGAGSILALRNKHRTYVQTNSATIEWSKRTLVAETTVCGTVIDSAEVVVSTATLTNAVLAMRVVVSRMTRSWDAYNPYTAWTANPIVPNLGGNAAAVIGGGAPAQMRRATYNGGVTQNA